MYSPVCRVAREGLWCCLCSLLDVPIDCAVGLIKDSVSLPLSLGGFGLRSATRSREAAYWALWAEALHMIHKRHRMVAEEVVRNLHGPRVDSVVTVFQFIGLSQKKKQKRTPALKPWKTDRLQVVSQAPIITKGSEGFFGTL